MYIHFLFCMVSVEMYFLLFLSALFFSCCCFVHFVFVCFCLLFCVCMFTNVFVFFVDCLHFVASCCRSVVVVLLFLPFCWAHPDGVTLCSHLVCLYSFQLIIYQLRQSVYQITFTYIALYLFISYLFESINTYSLLMKIFYMDIFNSYPFFSIF